MTKIKKDEEDNFIRNTDYFCVRCERPTKEIDNEWNCRSCNPDWFL